VTPRTAAKKAPREPLLEARGLVAGFGSHTVLHGVDLAVADGEFAGIFGLNGAGKSVTLKVLGGLVPSWEGTIRFRGQDITRASAEERVELGIGHVPQGRNVFANLTVEENLRLGAYVLRRRDSSRFASALSAMYERFPILGERRTQLAGTLSGGQQASLAVARALINEPSLIFVDEASAGLAPIVAAELLETLRQVAASGVTMLMVEQNVAFGLQIVDRAHVMQTGRVVYAGAVSTLDRKRLAGYLGIGRMLGATTTGALRKRRKPKRAARKTTKTRKAPARKGGAR
jgi:branched-chain amino acid transport system ATP-binding protein